MLYSRSDVIIAHAHMYVNTFLKKILIFLNSPKFLYYTIVYYPISIYIYAILTILTINYLII